MVAPAAVASAVATRGGAAALDYTCPAFETSQVMPAGYARSVVAQSAEQAKQPEAPLQLSALDEQRFHMLYREHFDFVFRNLRRLGVAPASLDDALQDVYLVVLRRISDLHHDEHLKAWLFAIIFRVAGNHRRTARRRGTPEPLHDAQLCSQQLGPFDLTARAQASQFLHGFLNTMDDNRRAVFVMAELEQLTAPEIAEALHANVNTVYSWLRTARIAFSKALRSARRAEDAKSHG
jgi:RNA polymerase sigma-70 factor (ECF subfamily)